MTRTVSIVSGCGVLLSMSSFYFVAIALRQHRAQIVLDAVFDQSVAALLAEKINHNFFENNSAAQVYSRAHSIVPALARVHVEKRPTHVALVTIEASKPKFFIQTKTQNLIATADGKIHEARFFVPELLQSLSKIYMHDPHFSQDKVRTAVSTWLNMLAADIFEHYAIDWHNKTEIVLTPRATPDVVFLVSSDTPLTAALMERAEKARAYCQKKPAQRKKITWSIDLRVRDAVVIAPWQKIRGQGGGHEGENSV